MSGWRDEGGAGGRKVAAARAGWWAWKAVGLMSSERGGEGTSQQALIRLIGQQELAHAAATGTGRSAKTGIARIYYRVLNKVPL